MSGSIRLAGVMLACAQLGLPAFAQGGVTGLKFVSSPGDYIGQGRRQTDVPPAATFVATGSAGYVEVKVTDPEDHWTLAFEALQGTPLAFGGYPQATLYPFNSPRRPALGMSGDGRDCNAVLGWFRVREYAVDGHGVVQKLAVDFVQDCEITGPPLYGALRINSRFPLDVTDLAAVAGPDADVFAKDLVTLDGSQSFAWRNGPIASVEWVQVEGPTVVLSDPGSLTPTFEAPAVAKSHPATLRFKLHISDQIGKTSADDVVVLVQGRRDGHAARGGE